MIAHLILVAWALANGVAPYNYSPASPPPGHVTVAVHVNFWTVRRIRLRAENRSNNPATVTFGPTDYDPETGCTSCMRVLSSPSPLAAPFLIEACGSVEVTALLAPYDGVTDFDGPSGLDVEFWFLEHHSATITEPAAVARLAQGRLWVERSGSFQGTLQGGQGTIGAQGGAGARGNVWFEYAPLPSSPPG